MNAYIFDVDGVISNVQTRKISNPQMLPLLVSLLEKRMPLGFISGRGMLWLRSNVIKILEEYVEKHPVLDKKILDLVYVSGEFGGVTCIHKNAIREESVNHDFIIPDEVKRGSHLVAFQYSDYASIETEKQTIFTFTANQSVKEEDFIARKNNMLEEFQQVIMPYPELEIQSDRLSLSIRYKKANKAYATEKFITWLKEKGFTPEKYYVFGDSQSDLEMGDELEKQHLPFEFIFVGNEKELGDTQPFFPLTITKGHCDEGTVEYLSGHKS